MIYLEKENDFEEITKNNLVLVDFYATWCGPCQLLSPVLEQVEKEVPNLKVLKVDVDKFQNLAYRYKVMSIPDLKVFRDGKIINQAVGYIDKNSLKELLK